MHNGTVYMFQEREKGRLQKLVKDFAKEASTHSWFAGLWTFFSLEFS